MKLSIVSFWKIPELISWEMIETAGPINFMVIGERWIDLQIYLDIDFQQGKLNSEISWNCYRKLLKRTLVTFNCLALTISFLLAFCLPSKSTH